MEGHMQRVAVRADGFAWNGRTYPSLSKVAFAITGTRWNGPKFFGLRDRPPKGAIPWTLKRDGIEKANPLRGLHPCLDRPGA